ncbi:MAG: hypothetical protein R2851_18455 [Caldilineaceae bacterium]
MPVITDDFTRVELTPHSGQWAAWLGGLDDETSWIQQRIVVPDPAVPLVYWEWIASAEESCAYDGAAISIDGLVLQQFGLSLDVRYPRRGCGGTSIWRRMPGGRSRCASPS